MSWKSALLEAAKPAASFSRPVIKPRPLDLNRVVTVDFETYYDTHYTLKKLSTSEYVRDERFKIQMVGVKIGTKPTQVLIEAQARKVLGRINWSTHTLLCHNTMFDGFVLKEHFGIVPSFYYDTLSMARALHSNEIGAGLDEVAKYYGGEGKLDGLLEQTKGVLEWTPQIFDLIKPYCAQDVDETFRIFQAMHDKFPADELEVIDLTMRMFCDPVLLIDTDRLTAEYQRELNEREQLFMRVIEPQRYDIGGDRHDPALLKTVLKTRSERALQGQERLMLIAKRLLGNNEFFADLLRAEGIEPPVKVSKAWIKKAPEERNDDDKYGYAFAKDDEDFVSLPERMDLWRGELSPDNPQHVPLLAAKQQRVQDLVDARLSVKSTITLTRAERMLRAGADGRRLPVGYAYYRAHTGRYGGTNKMNLQNLPRGSELRLSIMAPEGYEMCVVDSGQIEARVNAWLWGQDDLLDAFRKADTWDKSKGVARGNDRDAYCRFADDIYGREITTEDKTERFVGKVCLTGDTLVLTERGLVPLIEIQKTDKVWDGIEWVQHDGLIYQGKKTVIRCHGLGATADHEILTERGWQAWSVVLTDPSLFQSALNLVSLPSFDTSITQPRKVNFGDTARFADAVAALKRWCISTIFGTGAPHGVTNAPRLQPALNVTGATKMQWRMTSTELGCSTGFLPPSLAVATHATSNTNTMVCAGSLCTRNGKAIGLHFFDTYKHFLAGITHRWKWTASTPIEATNRATFVLSHAVKTFVTNGASKIWKLLFDNSEKRTDVCVSVYDLANAGPRKRFIVWTDRGFVLVHNCVLGLGYQMGAPKLQMTLAKGALGGPPVYFELNKCYEIVNAYRRRNHKIRDGWTKCQSIIEDMALGRTGSYKCLNWEKETIWLPNGMRLHYPDLKAGVNRETGYVEYSYAIKEGRSKIYGGLLCENLVQALARIIVFTQMLQINRRYRVVMSTHDEVVALPPSKDAQRCFDYMMKCMTTPPAWCADIPLNAEGGWARNYSK